MEVFRQKTYCEGYTIDVSTNCILVCTMYKIYLRRIIWFYRDKNFRLTSMVKSFTIPSFLNDICYFYYLRVHQTFVLVEIQFFNPLMTLCSNCNVRSNWKTPTKLRTCGSIRYGKLIYYNKKCFLFLVLFLTEYLEIRWRKKDESRDRRNHHLYRTDVKLKSTVNVPIRRISNINLIYQFILYS